MYSTIIGAIIFFIIPPVIFSRVFGWRGTKAYIGLIILGGLYLLYSLYSE